MVNVAVIGLGNIGQYHLNCYNDLKDVRILAVADVAEERVKATAGKFSPPHAFTDYRQVLALPEVEAVSVCLPNCLHAPVTIDAVNAGKHVLVEKPMAMNAAECEAMVAAARANNKTLAVSFNYRWNMAPDSWYLKHLIEQGRLGEIYYIRSVSLRRRTFLRGHKSWFSDKKVSGGAALIDMGPHMVDLAMWLAGDYDPVQVNGVTRTAIMTDTDVDDFASALIRLRRGTTIALESTWAGFLRPSMGITVLGTQGGAYLDCGAPEGERLTLFGADGNTLTETKPVDIVLPEPHEKTVHEHFVRSLQAHKTPQNRAECGLAVMRVLDAVYRSSETGRDVVIGG